MEITEESFSEIFVSLYKIVALLFQNCGTSVLNCGTPILNCQMNNFRIQQIWRTPALETEISQTLSEWPKEGNGQGDVRGRWKYCDRATVREVVLFLALLVKKRIQTFHKIIFIWDVWERQGALICACNPAAFVYMALIHIDMSIMKLLDVVSISFK